MLKVDCLNLIVSQFMEPINVEISPETLTQGEQFSHREEEIQPDC